MGYRIIYGDEQQKSRAGTIRNGGTGLLTALFFLLFLLSVKLVFEEETGYLQKVLLPGVGNLAETAVGSLVSSLHNGTPFKEAVTAFCREIIAGAQLG